MSKKTMGILSVVMFVSLVGIFLMGMNSKGSIQPVWSDPAVSFKSFEIWVSTLTQTELKVSGYSGYKSITVLNPSTSSVIYVGGSDVLTSTATTPSDMAKVGFPIGTATSTSTFNTFTINTALPLYAIGSANDTSSSTVHVMLSGWEY